MQYYRVSKQNTAYLGGIYNFLVELRRIALRSEW